MKIKVVVFLMLISLFVGVGTTYAALNFKATDVEFDPQDEEWEVSTVDDAIKYLKDNNKLNVVFLGESSTSYNLSEYPGYEKFEINKNIFIIPKGASYTTTSVYEVSHGASGSGGFTVGSNSYDPTTGVLTVNTNIAYGNAHGGDGNSISGTGSSYSKVYLVY